MKSKRVLVYRSVLLPYSETFIKQQILSLGSWSAELFGVTRVDGLSLEGIESHVLSEVRGSVSPRYFEVFRRLGLAPPRLVDYLKKRNFDIVHAHFATDAVFMWPTFKRLGVPLIVTLHGFDISIHRTWWESGKLGWIAKKYPSRLLQMARADNVRFIAVSDAIRNVAIRAGIPGEKITTRYIGIDLDHFQFSGPPIIARNLRILYVGRLVEKKGVRFLVEAFKLVRAEIPEAELVIVGDGPDLPALKELALDLQLPVSFQGRKTSEEILHELRLARVFCLPSVVADNGDAEGLGLVLVEAQACGVPVVTSALGGATEGIIPGVTGFGIGEKDVQSLAEKLTALLSDDELAASFSTRAREFVKSRFEIRACTQKLEHFYDLVAAGAA